MVWYIFLGQVFVNNEEITLEHPQNTKNNLKIALE